MRPKRPMKGEAIDDLSVIRYPVLAFAKIDGFRCIMDKTGAYTSRLVAFPNKSFMRATKGLVPDKACIDGEIVVGSYCEGEVLQRTSSGLTRKDDPEPDWNYWVFDSFEPGVPFIERHEHAAMIVRRINHSRVKLLPYRECNNEDELQAFIDECLEAGFEGVIVRSYSGDYKLGKSTVRQGWMLKIKPFEDQEGEVIGYFEEMENTNEAKRETTGKLKRSSAKAGKKAKGTLGGLILRDLTTGVEVRVGGGFTKEQRAQFWRIRDRLIGQVVTYKKQKVGEKNKPRHPNFKCFRPGWDFDSKD